LDQSRRAWKIALFMGLQSLTFYVILAWLPAILQSRGYDAEFSGWMLSLSQAAGILGSLVVPTFGGIRSDQRGIVWFLIIMEVIGLFGLLFPEIGLVPVWVSLIGFALGGTFGLALLFLILGSQDAESATELSGITQAIGYVVAATGPIIFGSIFDFSGSWTYFLLLLIFFAGFKLYMELGAGTPGKV
jgi:CP family cyanate transporter-like MFS transporter